LWGGEEEEGKQQQQQQQQPGFKTNQKSELEKRMIYMIKLHREVVGNEFGMALEVLVWNIIWD
jgi:hypothetical protein